MSDNDFTLPSSLLITDDVYSNVQIRIGNTVANTNALTVRELWANGTNGDPNQILTSDGTYTYWAAPTAVFGVNTYDRYTWVNNHTFVTNVFFGNSTVNSTINSTTYSGTANNASYLQGNTVSDIRLYSDNRAANAYSNAIAYSGNAVAAYANAISYANNTFLKLSGGTLTGNLVLGSVGLSANGSTGTSGQVLASNGSSTYWYTIPAGGSVTSVASGSGLTGGPITTSGILSVNAGTGIIANTTGVHVNSAYIATLSPTLTGTGASGVWNITSNYSYNVTQGFNSNWNTDFSSTPAGTMILRGDTSSGSSTGGPGGTWWFQQNFRHTNATNLWGVQVAWGWEDNANILRTRNITNGSYGGWVTYLNSNNYGSYALPLSGGTMTGAIYSASGVTSIIIGQQGGVTRGYLYNDPSGFGLLTSGGGWAVRVNYGSAGIYMPGSLGVGTDASGTTGEIRATNEVTAYYSDKRLKTDIEKISNASDKLKSITGILYRNNDLAKSFGFTKEDRQVGVLAQDVADVLPEAVRHAPFDIAQDGSSKSGENYLTVKYELLVPLLVEALKEALERIEKLESK